jgi:hypothetical protein
MGERSQARGRGGGGFLSGVHVNPDGKQHLCCCGSERDACALPEVHPECTVGSHY